MEARTIERILKSGISIFRWSMARPIARSAKQKAVTNSMVAKPDPMLLKKVMSKNHPMKFNRLTENTKTMEIQINKLSEMDLLNNRGFSHVLWSELFPAIANSVWIKYRNN